MPPEHPTPVSHKGMMDTFGFVGEEDYSSRVSDDRLKEILDDERTIVHEVSTEYNNDGEFLFVCVSRPIIEHRVCATFYGLGFHEQREKWYTDTWFWYQANNVPKRLQQVVPKEDVHTLIAQRRAQITRYLGTEEPHPQHAVLFEYLADLTNGDAASVELEDLGEQADWLASGLAE